MSPFIIIADIALAIVAWKLIELLIGRERLAERLRVQVGLERNRREDNTRFEVNKLRHYCGMPVLHYDESKHTPLAQQIELLRAEINRYNSGGCLSFPLVIADMERRICSLAEAIVQLQCEKAAPAPKPTARRAR